MCDVKIDADQCCFMTQSVFSEDPHLGENIMLINEKVTHMNKHFCLSKPRLLRGGVSGTLDQ